MSGVVSLDDARRRKAAEGELRYLPGVKPFDPTNPAHIQAWNTIHQLGWSELRAAERNRGDDD
jgi:hypothetical protein